MPCSKAAFDRGIIFVETNARKPSKANKEDAVNECVEEISAVMEKRYIDKVNAIEAGHFKETLKWKEKAQDLQRSLDQRNAQQLGDGAEVDLFKALKEAFPNDRITRVPPGASGVDIHHVIMHNRRECGKIVFDSKNRTVILATGKFPAGVRQLTIREGVIVASPAFVTTVVEILRRKIIQASSLRIAGRRARQQDCRSCIDHIAALLAES